MRERPAKISFHLCRLKKRRGTKSTTARNILRCGAEIETGVDKIECWLCVAQREVSVELELQAFSRPLRLGHLNKIKNRHGNEYTHSNKANETKGSQLCTETHVGVCGKLPKSKPGPCIS